MFDYEINHLKQIRQGLPECMVMLKSNQTFPLDKPGTLAAYGAGVRESRRGGTGSGEVNSRYYINVEEGLKQAGFKLTSQSWLDGTDKTLRYDSEAAIYVLTRISGEGGDRKPVEGDVLLTKQEIHDILDLHRHYKKFMLVLNVGGVIDLSPVIEVENILILSQLGVEMGPALADVLLGKTYPSGKITTTWSALKDYCPDIDTGSAFESYYYEGIYVGYRYFDTIGKRALFPFGYGVGYTKFELSDYAVSLVDSKVKAAVTVTNTGNFLGKEVVQAYITCPEVKLKKPYQELVGFQKTTELKPQESETVEIFFDMKDIASFDENQSAYVLEAGEYILRIGNSSVNTVPIAVIMLEKNIIVKEVKKVTEAVSFKEKTYERIKKEEVFEGITRLCLNPDCISTTSVDYNQSIEIAPIISSLTEEELIQMQIGNISESKGAKSFIGTGSVTHAGGAGNTTLLLRNKGIPSISMVDGPAGVRLSRDYYMDGEVAKTISRSVLPDDMIDNAPKAIYFICTTLLKGNSAPKNKEILHQYCTQIPIATAIAQSWNLDYARLCGDIVGEEMEYFDVNLWLAPGMNIHRSIFCGRNFEYYSEDPLLTAKFAIATTQAVQAHKGCGVTLKHYAANSQESSRYDNSSQITERTLREIYLKAFGLCVEEAKPCAIMTSYNLINNIHAAECRELIEGYLRAENGFDGFVMTDWIISLMDIGPKRHRGTSAEYVAAAGGDIFMPGSKKDQEKIRKALKNGMLTRERLEINASRLYKIIKKLSRE